MTVAIVPRFFQPKRESMTGRILRRLDWSLAAAALALALMGLLFIYSATIHGDRSGGFLTRQGLALAVGLTGMTLLTLVPYQVFQTYARGVYGAGILLLAATLIFGTRLRGSRSWLDLHWFYFQPVEIARLALAVALAAFAAARPAALRRGAGVATALGLTAAYGLLVLLQPDLSSALAMGPMALAVLFAAGAPFLVLASPAAAGAIALGIPLASTYFSLVGDRFEGRWPLAWLSRAFLEPGPFWQLWAGVCGGMAVLWWFLRRLRVGISGFYLLCSIGVVAAGVLGSFGVEKTLKTYQRKRLIAFVDPAVDPLGAGYNILQSEIAVGSGRFFGKGYTYGSQTRLGFLPEKHTDFIFSLVGEELGFVGGVVVLVVFFWVAWRGFDIARTARDPFGRYLAVGLATYFAFSGLVNVGMVMGLMPVTGVPLPFLSYGGSGLVGAFLAVGLLLSVHLRRFVL